MALTNTNNTFSPAQKAIKVAAYCRVSTLYDEQEDSLENQSVHYTNYIRENPEWRFVGIYSDHGKSGTMTEGRSGFKRLIRHAILGKIDLVLCKSVSRFARNVFDTIDKIRMLKEKGVRVIFEKENIDTHDDGRVDFEFKCGITRSVQAIVRKK